MVAVPPARMNRIGKRTLIAMGVMAVIAFVAQNVQKCAERDAVKIGGMILIAPCE